MTLAGYGLINVPKAVNNARVIIRTKENDLLLVKIANCFLDVKWRIMATIQISKPKATFPCSKDKGLLPKVRWFPTMSYDCKIYCKRMPPKHVNPITDISLVKCGKEAEFETSLVMVVLKKVSLLFDLFLLKKYKYIYLTDK